MSDLDALAPRNEEEVDSHFEPVIRLTQQIEIKTGEENDDVIFKMRAKLFRFDSSASEWKERGTGDVRLLQHKDNKKVRLVMRRDKTLKVCANHFITSEMRLQPNIGSDRSWVWKVLADYSESLPTSETLAIRFANSGNAEQFKIKFEEAQKINASLVNRGARDPVVQEEMVENKAEETKVEVAKADEPAAADLQPATEKLEEIEKAQEAPEETK